MTSEAKRRADIPVRHGAKEAGWKTRPPVIEAEARETDKALQHILKQLGI
jgi:hypothetical protein